GGLTAEHRDRARGRREQADGQLEQGRLAGAVRADQAGHASLGNLQRAVAEGGAAPVALAEPAGLQGGHAMSSSEADRKVLRKRASMLSSSRPARRARPSQRRRSRRSGSYAASDEPLRLPVTNVPRPGRAATRPWYSSSR